MHSRLVTFVALLVANIARVAAAFDDASDAELERIRAAHRRWRESIVSVKFAWKTVYDKNSKFSRDTNFPDIQRTSYDEFIWCDDGRYRLYGYGQHNSGPEILRSLHCGDGRRSYAVRYDSGPSQPDQPKIVSIHAPPSPGRGGGMHQDALAGLWYSTRNYWFSDMLDHGLVAVDGFEELAGEKLTRVKVEWAPGEFQTVLLDPAKGYLPRLSRSGDWREEVTEHRFVEPGLWMPWSGSFTGGGDAKTWEMTEIVVNGPLDPKLFQPPMAPGTQIVEAGKIRYHGGAANRPAVEERLVQDAKANLNHEAAASIPASPPSATGWWPASLVILSILLLTVAFWLKKFV